MLPGMASKPRITIVGAGNLGSALAVALRGAGYGIEWVVGHGTKSLQRAQALGKKVNARASTGVPQQIDSELIWFCVPDSQIAAAAKSFSRAIPWTRKFAFHSSGALTSDELAILRKRGAMVASVHPLMTFVRGSRPSLAGVPFAVEGDAAAVKLARQVIADLGGRVHSISKKEKAAYHAWGTFASPLFTSLLAVSEQVASMAGVKNKSARQRMIPILLQTLANYASFGPAGAFSGPIVRGDVDTVKRHLRVLRGSPEAHRAYQALALAAVKYLPSKNKAALRRALTAK